MKVEIFPSIIYVDERFVADLIDKDLRTDPETIRVVNNSEIHARVLVWRANNKIIAVLDTKENEFMEPDAFRKKYGAQALTYKITEIRIIRIRD